MPVKQITLKVGELLLDTPKGIRPVVAKLCGLPLRPRYSIPLAKLKGVLDREAGLCNQERLKIITEYGIQANPCTRCSGKVQVDGQECPECKGAGWVKNERSGQWQVNRVIAGERWGEFIAKYNELILADVDFEAPMIDIPDTLDIAADDISVLFPFMENINDPVAEAEKIVKRG